MNGLILQQKLALPTIKWLIDPSNQVMGTGRTELLAHAFIQLAIENPGTHITVFDHFQNPKCRKELIDRIFKIWNESYLNPDKKIDLALNKSINAIFTIT